MEYSKYQKEIFNNLASKGNMYIEAVAGSGKTTTLIECARQLESGLFVAFNKSIQLELSERLKDTKFDARTIHSLGFGLVASLYPDDKITIDNKKLSTVVKNLILDPQDPTWYDLFISPLDESDGISLDSFSHLLTKLVEMSVNACTDDLNYLFSTYNLDIFTFLSEQDYPRIRIFIQRALEVSVDYFKEFKVITYQDMLYLPLTLKLRPPIEKVVFIDEAQDLSPLQSNFINLYINDDTKVVFVGDPRQSIYLFTGAAPDSILDLAERYKAKKYPLSICYRCPEKHIELAKEINPIIEGTNKEGDLEYLENNDKFLEIIKQDTDLLILSRKNAPLLGLCLKLIFHEKVKAFILGREIVGSLLKYISRIKESKEITIKSINEEIDKDLEKVKEGEEIFNFLVDLKICFEVIYEEWELELHLLKNRKKEYTHFLKEKINSLCGDKNDPNAVCLSTVHKSKGLERKNVAILEYNLFPYYFKGASALAYQQELNLQYVAITRSKQNLYLIDKPKKPNKVEKIKDVEVKLEPIDLKKYNDKRLTFTGKIGKTEWVNSYEDYTKPVLTIIDLKLNETPLKLSTCKFNKGKSWQSFKVGDTVVFNAKVKHSSKETKLERPTQIKKYK